MTKILFPFQNNLPIVNCEIRIEVVPSVTLIISIKNFQKRNLIGIFYNLHMVIISYLDNSRVGRRDRFVDPNFRGNHMSSQKSNRSI